jgi:hypothetical protein
MARDPGAQKAPTTGSLPGPVRLIRILLFVLAAFTALVVIGALIIFEVTAEMLGALTWTALPGIVGLVVALRISRSRSRALFWTVIAIAVLTLLGALGSLGNGDPRGFPQLVIPIALLVAVTRPEARRWFARDTTDSAADAAYRY